VLSLRCPKDLAWRARRLSSKGSQISFALVSMAILEVWPFHGRTA
jgi:hypothetical protein